MHLKLMCLIPLCWCGLTCFGQVADATSASYFLEKNHFFGEVLEEDQLLTRDFIFVNRQPDSIKVAAVSPSCGCLVPQWDKEYIAPGDSGVVIIGFNPLNRPGAFVKTTEVLFSNGRSETLQVTGEVLSGVSVEKRFPFDQGPLRLAQRRLMLPTSAKGDTLDFELKVFNMGPDTVFYVDSLTFLHASISLAEVPALIAPSTTVVLNGQVTMPQQSGYVELGNQLGYSHEEGVLNFEVIANVVPEAALQSTEAGGELFFEKTIIDLGEQYNDGSVPVVFELVNKGSAAVLVDRVIANCSCLAVPDQQLRIAPNETFSLEVLLDTGQLLGRQQKTLHLYTNARNRQLHQLMIKVNVKQTGEKK